MFQFISSWIFIYSLLMYLYGEALFFWKGQILMSGSFVVVVLLL